VLAFLGLPDLKLENFEIINPGRYEEMAASTKNKLKEYFNPYNHELYEFLGNNFGW
jgi:hypothetical protein